MVDGSDVLVFRYSKSNDISIKEGEGNVRDASKIQDVSLTARRTETGKIDTVMISMQQDDYKIVKVRVRQYRIPQIGDKFASRHGQKGTVGMTYRQEDLPFNYMGIAPDLVINPHCIPSRMTIGHMIECLNSKLASLTGKRGDASPFNGQQYHTISQQLHEQGHQKDGNETLYNPYTGNLIDTKIFFGPTYYQRLRHLVADKMYSRTRGPIVGLTRQPTHGRARHGGLRFGEMERDCIIAHGTSRFLKERTFEVSDLFRVHVCSNCGLFAVAIPEQQNYYCKSCANIQNSMKKGSNKSYKIVQVYLPYACKLMIQELMAMHIIPRILVDTQSRSSRTIEKDDKKEKHFFI